MTDHKTNEQGMIPESLSEYISYRDGYRYQLAEDYYAMIDIFHYQDIDTEFINLTKHGLLWVKKGYASDGPSGPTKIVCDILTILGLIPFIGRIFLWHKRKVLETIMRGAVGHDACYELLRKGLLPPEARLPVDKELKKACLKDGMSKIRAWYVYRGVRRFAGYASDPKNEKRTYHAPEFKGG